MKKILDLYIGKVDNLLNSLKPLASADSIFPDVHALVAEMQKEAENCNDEMLYPTLYNAAATIATAPEGCSVRQLKEALEEAREEMKVMKEYM